MRCQWCYIPFRGGAPKPGQSLSVLRRLINHGFKVITIGGGDPTSYQFWGDLAREARSNGLFVHLDTNGIGPGNRLEALKGDLAGMHSIRISDR